MDAGPTMATDDIPSLAVRTQRLAAWAWGLALFLSVGWMAMSPDDPRGPVSLLTRHNALMMWVQVTLLAVVCSVVATILAGRHLPEAGLFATALGFSAVALRGDTAQYFLVNCAADGVACERWLAVRFAGEAVAWFVALGAAIPAANAVLHWCGWSVLPPLAAAEMPPEIQVPRRTGAQGILARAAQNQAIRHLVIVTGVLLMGTALFSSGSSRRAVLHGQSCFVLFAAAFLATWAGCRLAPVRGPMVSLAAIPLAAVTGFLGAALLSGRFATPPNLPSSCFLRILPLHFVAVGVAAVVAAHWWMRGEDVPPPYEVGDNNRSFNPAPIPPSGDKRR